MAALREMLAVIPKHKGTDKLQADLRRRLSQLKKDLEQKKKASGRQQEDPYIIEKQGAGQVVLLGWPNVGKSALVKHLTRARIEVARYPFTTNLPQPGMMPYEDVLIQLVDTPPVTEEGIPGPFTVTIRNADLLLVVIDLESDTCLEQVDFLLDVLREKRILRESVPEGVQAFTLDQCLFVGSKADCTVSGDNLGIIEELMDGEAPDIMPVSVEDGTNIEELRQRLFEALRVIRIYSKAPGEDPDMDRPFVMPAGSTVIEFARKVHKDLAQKLKSARVWGSARFDGQAVAHNYVLEDRDVVELNT